MKQFSKKNILVCLLTSFLLFGTTLKAQQTTLASVENVAKTANIDSVAAMKGDKKSVSNAVDADAWVPVRRLWGYSFGDFYYDAHADAANRGPETMYNDVPTNRNAFQFRRLYLGYDYDISQRFTAEVLLASEPNANTGVNGLTGIQNGDNLVDNKMSFFIKNFNLRYKNLWNGTDLVVGEMSTPGFALSEPGTNAPNSLSESVWGYRAIEKPITDFHKTNSYDIGASLQGTFDPDTKNFGYVFMVGNNTGASLLSAENANSGFFKIFYGDLWGKFLPKKNLYADLYADYAKTSSTTPTVGPQSHNIFKAFVSYNTHKLSVGAEAYTQKLSNAVFNTTSAVNEDATVNAISLWVKGAILSVEDPKTSKSITKLGFFARYDAYNPDTKYKTANSYTINPGGFSNYNPVTKERFITAGLDFVPQPITAGKVHFEPNIWYISYKDQRDANVVSRVANDHTLVYRMTVFFTFGK